MGNNVAAQETNGRRSVAGILEGIEEIKAQLTVDCERLMAEEAARAASVNIVKRQIDVLQSVLDAPFAQPGQREDTSD